MLSSRQPTGVLAGRSGSGSVSDDQAAESAARAAPRDRLENPYSKFSHRRGSLRVDR
jgi:hypothetical protein